MIGLKVATVFIPTMLRPLADDRQQVEVAGTTVRELVENLTATYPRLRSRLLDGGDIRGNISVAIDGEVSTLGMLESIDEHAEVHFVPAIAGGIRGGNADTVG